MRAIPPHIAITYQPKSVYEPGKRGVPSVRPSTTFSPDTCKPMTKPLSPAAQAVLDAAVLPCTIREGIAAAIRAVADRVVPHEQPQPRRGMRPGGTGAISPYEGAEDQRAATRRKLLGIAAELEGNP